MSLHSSPWKRVTKILYLCYWLLFLFLYAILSLSHFSCKQLSDSMTICCLGLINYLIQRVYLSIIRNRNWNLNQDRGVLDVDALALFLSFMAFPSFSVTTHSLTRFASKSPIIAALVRWSDMTFSKSIQSTSRCMDLSHIQVKLEWIKKQRGTEKI